VTPPEVATESLNEAFGKVAVSVWLPAIVLDCSTPPTSVAVRRMSASLRVKVLERAL